MWHPDEDRVSRDLRARLEEFCLDVRSIEVVEPGEGSLTLQEFADWKMRLQEAEDDLDIDAAALAQRMLRPFYLGDKTDGDGGRLLIHRYPKWLWNEETVARCQPKHCSRADELCLHSFCPAA